MKLNYLFIYFLGIITCLSLNNKLLRIVKEGLILTLPEGGASLIPFLKLWIVIPLSIALVILARFLRKRFSLYALFQFFTLGFVAYYILFLTVLYPHRNEWTIPTFSWLPETVNLASTHWIVSLFYVMGDIWSMMFLSILFWNITALFFTLSDAKKFYPIFSLDIAGISIGLLVGLFRLKAVEELIAFVILVAILQMGVLYLVKRRFPQSPPAVEKNPQETAKNGTWKTSIALLLGMIVFSYEFTDTFLDLLWKWNVSKLHTTTESYNHFMSQVTFWIGIVGTLTCLFLAKPLTKRLPWRALALITPALAALSSGAFLFSLFYPSPLETTILLGVFMSCTLQITKNTFFDISKELSLVVQDEKSRFHAKTFADGLMTRCGKSSASLLQQILLIVLLNFESSFPLYATFAISLVLCAWIYATFQLNKQVESRYAYSSSN